MNFNKNEKNYFGFDFNNQYYQHIDPRIFSIVGQILGDALSGNIPFNVQNALGNWLELVGQTILVFNSQQAYFENGPGLYFKSENYNIYNTDKKNVENKENNIEVLMQLMKKLQNDLKKLDNKISDIERKISKE